MTGPAGTPRHPEPDLEPSPEPEPQRVPAPQRAPRPGGQGVSQRVANTPMRDLTRGRISGRLDVNHLLRTSTLPPQLRSIVAGVVNRTRLWKRERADVAVELLGHFRDGLASGESSDALAAAFGPARRAARLITRAKRRNRSLLYKTWVRSVQFAALVLAVFVGVYVVATVRLFTGSPTVEHDYLGQLNAVARAVPENDRAWPLYRRALLALGDGPPALQRVSGPADAGWPEVQRYLVAHAGALALAREGAERPGLGFVVGYNVDAADRRLWPEIGTSTNEQIVAGGLAQVLLPLLRDLRHLGRLLALDAKRAAEAGNGGIARADIEAVLALSEHAVEVPCLPNGLASMSLLERAIAACGGILAAQPEVFGDADLSRLAHRFAAAHGARIEFPFEGERLGFKDMIQRIYTDDGEGDGRLTAEGLASLGSLQDGARIEPGPLAPAVGLVLAGRREMSNEFRRWFALVEGEAAKPLWRREPGFLEQEIERLEASPFYVARYLPILRYVEPLVAATRMPEVVTQQRDALVTAIALEMYRRREGRWPDALEALVPDLLPMVPPDRFDGTPLRYRLADGRPQLYSIGADRDDDGGRGKAHVRLTAAEPEDGDWVLWPPPGTGSALDHRAELSE